MTLSLGAVLWQLGINQGGKVVYKLIAVLLMCSGTTAGGQTPAKPLVLIKAGRLFDARSGRMLTAQAILIEGDRIKEVGDAAVVMGHAPGARIIDLSTVTVLPGLIDCHAHVLGNLKDYSPTRDLRTSSPQGVLWGLHNLQTWLDHGFEEVWKPRGWQSNPPADTRCARSSVRAA